MSDVNKHGHNLHPDLPRCVNCNYDDYQITLTQLGCGAAVQYCCKHCGTQLVYVSRAMRDYQSALLRILAWVRDHNVKKNWDILNAYLNEVQKFRDGKIPAIPARPLEIEVHILKNGVWHREP